MSPGQLSGLLELFTGRPMFMRGLYRQVSAGPHRDNLQTVIY